MGAAIVKHEDTNHQCGDFGNIEDYKFILPLGASISILCYIYLIWMFFFLKSPVLNRHPTEFAIYKCMAEFAAIQQYLWVPFLSETTFYKHLKDEPPIYCVSTVLSGVMSFFTECCIMGDNLFFLCISVELRNAYTNPFSSVLRNKSTVFIQVLAFSMFLGGSLIIFGPQVYGLSSLGLPWIQSSRTNASAKSYNATYWLFAVPKLLLYYIWTASIYAYSIWANFIFVQKVQKGLPETVSKRIQILNRSKRYVFFYCCFGGVAFFFESIAYGSSYKAQLTFSAASIMNCFRGLFSLIAIILSNYEDATWENMNPFKTSQDMEKSAAQSKVKESLLLQPHLNSALRAELLFFTTQGIIYSVRDYYKLSNEATDINTDVGKSGDIGDKDDDIEEIAGRKESIAEMEMQMNHSLYEFCNQGDNDDDDDDDDRMSSRETKQWGNAETGPSASKGNGRNSVTRSSIVLGRGSILGLGRDSCILDNMDDRGKIKLGLGQRERESIIRLQVQQEEKIEEIAGNALQKELEDIEIRHSMNDGPQTEGMPRKSMTRDSINDFIRDSLSGVRSRSGVGRESDTRMREVSTVVNPVLHLQHQRPAWMDNCREDQMSIDSSSRCSEVEMRPSDNTNTTTHTQSRDDSTSGHSVLSSSSEDTVKWRSTNDVTFQMHTPDSTTRGMFNTKSTDYCSDDSGAIFSAKSQTRFSKEPNKARTYSDSSSLRSSSTLKSTSTFSRSLRKFSAPLEYAIKAATVFSTTPIQHFRFRDFCPRLFAKVRDECGIEPHEYAEAFQSTCKESFSEGRSGAFLFFSRDEKYLAKTMEKSELLCLMRIMPEYVSHLRKNPDSLIVRFLGAHCIKMYEVDVYFVVMMNFFPQNKKLSERYDLKGSWINRYGRKKVKKNVSKEKSGFSLSDAPPLYQDNDLQHKILLDPEVVDLLARAVRRDIEFLRDQNLMDYSLLVGVVKERYKVIDKSNSQPVQSRNLSAESQSYVSSIGTLGKASNAMYIDGPGSYYFGIIDVLQEWNFAKRCERFFKTWVLGKDGDGLSCMPAFPYSERFWESCVVQVMEGVKKDVGDTGLNDAYKNARVSFSMVQESPMRHAVTGRLGSERDHDL